VIGGESGGFAKVQIQASFHSLVASELDKVRKTARTRPKSEAEKEYVFLSERRRPSGAMEACCKKESNISEAQNKHM